MAGEFDQTRIHRHHFLELVFVRVADDRDKHAVLGFDGKTDVDRTRVDDLVADEAAGRGAVLAQCHGQRAQSVERDAGFFRGGFAVREHLVEFDGQNDGGQRSCPTAAHGIGHGDAHGGGLGDFLLVEVLHETFEVLDGDASARTAAGHPGEIGGAESEFRHTRLHARRKISGAAGVGGNGEAFDRRFGFV